MSRVAAARPLLAPVLLILAVALIGSTTSTATQQNFITALVSVTIVVGLYVFIGNAGVISFGQISFVAIGAYSAGELTLPTQPKHFVLPGLWSFIQNHSVGNIPSLAIAAGLGALYALAVGLPLMRLSGLAAGIATFAVLEITYNVLTFWPKIAPQSGQTLSLVPTTTGLTQATVGAIIAAAAAFLYQSSRRGRLLRASREDPAAAQAAGVNIRRERLIAFTLSGAIAGLAGGLLVHQIGSIIPSQVYLDLTFLTLAMLVVGGTGSLWGATVGAIIVSLLDTYLSNAENGLHLGFFKLTLPSGAADLILGLLMVAMLIFRPQGLTGGREWDLTIPHLRRRRSETRADASGASGLDQASLIAESPNPTDSATEPAAERPAPPVESPLSGPRPEG
ncbi:MAG: branched-chain amino acid ABC transporter permease [Solirubrobacterales bacterium]|nr:branched-chain amino acid ABC transporter permease [Solirubrobacterales bacterium]MBV9797764.1 branched-chain amino acid ABC transporter permease [Solirubrobacterales bacterium]